MIYFFWNRWFKNVQRRSEPISDNNKTDELKIIKAEYKKEVEIKPPEKEKAGKELQLKNEEKHNFISLNSDNLEAPAPANQIKDTNLNGALAPRKNAMASNNNLEENNMGIVGSKVKKFFCGTEKSESAVQTDQPAPEPQVLPSNISPISIRSNNDSNNSINPNDINDTFEYPNVDKKALNAMGSKIKQEIKKDMDDRFAENTNDMNNLKEQVNKNTEDIKEVNKKVDKIQEEQIDIKKMLAEMKEERKDTKRMLEKMEEDKKAHDGLMAALWNKLDEWNGIKSPTREGNDNRESTNTSLSSFKYKNPFRNNKPKPKMERADMAHSQNNEY